MSSTIFGTSYSCPPGEYEESELDHRKVKRSVPPVRLRGDPERARVFYQSLRQRRRKSKLYLSGVHTFKESAAVVVPVQDEFMDSFEQMIFAGHDPERFMRLWYRHEDKGLIELHWNFLLQDLKTGRLVTLYYRARDWAIFEVWEELANRRYGFRSRRDPSLAKLLKVSYQSPVVRHPEEFAMAKHRIEGIPLGEIQNRTDLCHRLEAHEFHVVEQQPKWLRADSKFGSLTLTGACCHEAFTSPDYLARVMGRKKFKWETFFTSREWLESEFKRLMAYRSQWLEKTLNGGNPRFGLQVPAIDGNFSLEQIQQQLQIEITKEHHERIGKEHIEYGREIPRSIAHTFSGIREQLAKTFEPVIRVGSEAAALRRAIPPEMRTASTGIGGDGSPLKQDRGALRRPSGLAAIVGNLDGFAEALRKRARRRRDIKERSSGIAGANSGVGKIDLGGAGESARLESIPGPIRQLSIAINRFRTAEHIRIGKLSEGVTDCCRRLEDALKSPVSTCSQMERPGKSPSRQDHVSPSVNDMTIS